MLRKRAEAIARTETIRFSTLGQLAGFDDALARGLLATNIRKIWITTDDDRLCKFCRKLNGETRGLREKFRTKFGVVDGPPAHPLCRCALGFKFDRVAARSAARSAA
jgi:hypothetical protein